MPLSSSTKSGVDQAEHASARLRGVFGHPWLWEKMLGGVTNDLIGRERADFHVALMRGLCRAQYRRGGRFQPFSVFIDCPAANDARGGGPYASVGCEKLANLMPLKTTTLWFRILR